MSSCIKISIHTSKQPERNFVSKPKFNIIGGDIRMKKAIQLLFVLVLSSHFNGIGIIYKEITFL